MKCYVCFRDKGNVKKMKAENVYLNSGTVATINICEDCLEALNQKREVKQRQIQNKERAVYRKSDKKSKRF